MNLGDEMGSGGQPVGKTVREARETLPWRPASNPLPGFLNRKGRGAHDTAVCRLVFQSSQPTIRGQLGIDDRALDLVSLPRVDAVGTKDHTQSRGAERPEGEGDRRPPR